MSELNLEPKPQWVVYKTDHTIELILDWYEEELRYGQRDPEEVGGRIIGKRCVGGSVSFDCVELRQSINPRSRVRHAVHASFMEIASLYGDSLPEDPVEAATLTIIEEVIRNIQ